MTQAFLWTDCRYYIEASEVLDENWILMKDGSEGVPTLTKWLEGLPSGLKIGTDFHYLSHADYERYSKAIKDSSKIFTNVKNNLVDIVWKEEGFPVVKYIDPVIHDIKFAGVTWEEKIKSIRGKMKDRNCDLLILSALDEIAWLFNLRGSDIHCCPVFFSYALITIDRSLLFVDQTRITESVADHLNIHKKKGGEFVEILPYDSIEKYVSEMSEEYQGKLWINSNTPQFLVDDDKKKMLNETNPVCIAKSVKNEVEIQNIKCALVREAAVLCEFFGYLENHLDKEDIDEYSASLKLSEMRVPLKNFVMNSFDSIIGSGSNAAIIHYKPEPKTSKKIQKNEILLIDTGGNYLDGTTDITRTMHFGKPTEIEIECYTAVLKGHISLACAKFPKGTKGCQIDCLARAPLWDLGLNYGHGTGHGIGMFLNVHEGPQNISPKYVDQCFLAGNLLSNEPGYYKAGSFGIRIESMITVVPFTPKYKEEDSQIFQFDTISLVPMHRSLINKSLLTPSEIAWLNDFHAKCVEVLTPALTELKFNYGLEYLKKNAVQI